MMHWVPAIVYIRFIKESGSHFSRLLAAILITMSLLSFLQLSYMLRCPLSLLFKVVVCFKDSRLFLWQIWSNLDNGARSNVGYYFVKLSFPLKKKNKTSTLRSFFFFFFFFSIELNVSYFLCLTLILSFSWNEPRELGKLKLCLKNKVALHCSLADSAIMMALFTCTPTSSKLSLRVVSKDGKNLSTKWAFYCLGSLQNTLCKAFVAELCKLIGCETVRASTDL